MVCGLDFKIRSKQQLIAQRLQLFNSNYAKLLSKPISNFFIKVLSKNVIPSPMATEVLLSLNVMRVCKLGQHNCYFIEEAQGLLSD